MPLTIGTQAASVLAGVSRTLGELVAHIPGDMRRPTDLQHTLHLDYKLCWQVINIIRAENPLSISQYIPGNTSLKKLMTAASAAGVSSEIISDAEQAIREFHEVVAVHSNDRQAFDCMIASISGGGPAEALTLQHRRNAFRSESKVWGLQVETDIRQTIFHRAADGSLEKCFVNAKYKLRRFRREVLPIVHGYRDVASGASPEKLEPLEPDSAQQYGAPLLQEFCSQPVPRFKTIQHSDGWIYSALESDKIGRQGSVNLVFGGLARNFSKEFDEQGRAFLHTGAAFIAPTELCIVEMIVHRPSFGNITPELQVYATAAGSDVPEVMRRTQQFPIYEKVNLMGRASVAAAVPEVPRYRGQLNYVFQQLGWNPEEFDVYRVRLAYPILHTLARISFYMA